MRLSYLPTEDERSWECWADEYDSAFGVHFTHVLQTDKTAQVCLMCSSVELSIANGENNIFSAFYQLRGACVRVGCFFVNKWTFVNGHDVSKSGHFYCQSSLSKLLPGFFSVLIDSRALLVMSS